MYFQESRKIMFPEHYFFLFAANWHDVDEDDCKDLGGEMVGPGCHLPHYVPDVFFFCCLLFIFTFCISYMLKNIKTCRFFTTTVSLCLVLLKCLHQKTFSESIQPDDILLYHLSLTG